MAATALAGAMLLRASTEMSEGFNVVVVPWRTWDQCETPPRSFFIVNIG
jgi:hypothetical protein